MSIILDTYDPCWQEKFASLSQLFKLHWNLHAPPEQLDSLARRQRAAFDSSFETPAAFDAFMKGKAIEHGLCTAEAWPTHAEGASIEDVKQTYADLVEADKRRKAVAEIRGHAIRLGLCTAERWRLCADASIREASAVVRDLMRRRR
jgi:hypothetical protein